MPFSKSCTLTPPRGALFSSEPSLTVPLIEFNFLSATSSKISSDAFIDLSNDSVL